MIKKRKGKEKEKDHKHDNVSDIEVHEDCKVEHEEDEKLKEGFECPVCGSTLRKTNDRGNFKLIFFSLRKINGFFVVDVLALPKPKPKEPWRKILYVRQGYPDNYVDPSTFLRGLITNGTINLRLLPSSV